MEIISQVFEGQEVSVREDGYWNATLMCQKFDKRINNFIRSEQTQEYLKALAEELGCSPKALIISDKGGDVRTSGTWVHQRVALKLAAWLNPKFEVWVFSIIEKLLTQGEVRLKDEIENLKAALSDSEGLIEAREVQLKELSAESKYWREELTLYREGYHPDCEEVGQYNPGD